MIEALEIEQEQEIQDVWGDVGVFPTPEAVVESFTGFVLKSLKTYKGKLHVLDLFAGDGRLGDTFRSYLPKERLESLTFLEIRENAISSNILNGSANLVAQNGFEYEPSGKFDVVISNPPYLALNSKQAIEMGFSWKEVQTNGKNLYGLGISKAISLCKPGAISAIIAPFGYLRGVNSALLREEIEKHCEEVVIRASTNRNLFEDANQDIAFQIFKKRTSKLKGKTKWKFAYEDGALHTIHVNLPFSKATAEKYVRVGPIVWNRKKEFLTSNNRDNIAVIYGGNITHDGRLDFNIAKYREKQFIERRGTIPTDIITTPFIAIRRILRGKPGSWIVDSALVAANTMTCTGENHTIIVELPDLPAEVLKQIQTELEEAITNHYFHSGSPTISTVTVGKLFSRVVRQFLDE